MSKTKFYISKDGTRLKVIGIDKHEKNYLVKSNYGIEGCLLGMFTKDQEIIDKNKHFSFLVIPIKDATIIETDVPDDLFDLTDL